MCSWHRLIVLAITAVPLFYLVAIEIAFTLKRLVNITTILYYKEFKCKSVYTDRIALLVLLTASLVLNIKHLSGFSLNGLLVSILKQTLGWFC